VLVGELHIALAVDADEKFPVLQKYEREALYDANGRQLPTKLAGVKISAGPVGFFESRTPTPPPSTHATSTQDVRCQ
jgi:hypothetical protein